MNHPFNHLEPDSLNQHRVEALLIDLLLAIKHHYLSGPINRSSVYEVLNALAAASALTLHGSDNNPDAFNFFRTALANHMDPHWINAFSNNENPKP